MRSEMAASLTAMSCVTTVGNGQPLPGFALADMPELYGDELAATAAWKKAGSDLSALAGKVVRLRVVLRDADLYALRFAK